MKKISILINKEKLEINSTISTFTEYIYNYINYKLSPYKMVGLFSYNTYPTNPLYIDGRFNPQMLIEHIHQTSCIINNSESPVILYNKDYEFFNAESGHFYLTTNEYIKISGSPQNYCIIFSNIYY